jgi:succinate dehydrogenase/fumarate reductase cytochrome b subunit
MPSIQTWKKLTALSGLAFGTFLWMHLLCHASLSIRWELAQANLLKTRAIYQHPLFEAGMVLALLIHMMSNAVVVMHRRKITALAAPAAEEKEPAGTTLELKAHRTAGIILGISIVGHVAATRIGPLLFLDDPAAYDYSFVAKVNDEVPYNLFSVYMAIFAMAAVWHGIYGTRSALAMLSGGSVIGTAFPVPLKFLASLSHLIMISAAASLTGYYYVIDKDAKAALHEDVFKGMGMH